MYGVDLAWFMNEKVVQKIPGGGVIDFLFPEKSTKLESVGHFAIEGVMGNIDADTNQIVTPEMFIEYESQN